MLEPEPDRCARCGHFESKHTGFQFCTGKYNERGRGIDLEVGCRCTHFEP